MRKTKKKTSVAKPLLSDDRRLPFLEHVNELKRRLMYVAVSVTAFGTAAYFVQHQIVGILLAPAEGQEMMYTTPGGGLDFLFRVCIYTGIVFSLPVIIYQFLKYLEPLLGEDHVRFALKGSIISGLLAAAGMTFGYFAGMPAALHFLFHQFTTPEIKAMITIQSYMHFVTIYMFGAALLFQVPLVMIFINRIKPLSPKTLFKNQKWMILGAFILAVIMNPTPNVVDQLLLAGPMIIMYYVGIGIIALGNRRSLRKGSVVHRRKKYRNLLEEDAKLQAERESRLLSAKTVWQQAVQVAEHPTEVQEIIETQKIQQEPMSTPARQTVRRPASPRPAGRGRYVDSMRPAPGRIVRAANIDPADIQPEPLRQLRPALQAIPVNVVD